MPLTEVSVQSTYCWISQNKLPVHIPICCWKAALVSTKNVCIKTDTEVLVSAPKCVHIRQTSVRFAPCLYSHILRAPAESQSSLKKTGSYSYSTRYISRMLAQIPRDDNSNVNIVCAGEKGKGKPQECSRHFE